MKIITICLIFSINNTDSLKQWPEGKLVWNDFNYRNEIIVNDESAKSRVGLSLSYIEYGADSVSVESFAFFNLQKSWTKDTSNVALLKHEQLHFDIVELARREFVKKCLAQQGVSIEQLNSYFEEAKQKYKTLNVAYDSETRHGLDNKTQGIWENSVSEQLSELEEFKSFRIVICN